MRLLFSPNEDKKPAACLISDYLTTYLSNWSCTNCYLLAIMKLLEPYCGWSSLLGVSSKTSKAGVFNCINHKPVVQSLSGNQCSGTQYQWEWQGIIEENSNQSVNWTQTSIKRIVLVLLTVFQEVLKFSTEVHKTAEYGQNTVWSASLFLLKVGLL